MPGGVLMFIHKLYFHNQQEAQVAARIVDAKFGGICEYVDGLEQFDLGLEFETMLALSPSTRGEVVALTECYACVFNQGSRDTGEQPAIKVVKSVIVE
jgi:hypothetical protein